MIDQTNADADLWQLKNQLHQLSHLGLIQPCRRFIEQQKQRICAQSDGNTQSSEISEWHRSRSLITEPEQPNEIENLFRRIPSQFGAVVRTTMLTSNSNVLSDR